MAKILICYGTKEGHTAAIAERIRETLVARGHDVGVERARRTPAEIADGVEGVIVGASVHKGVHQDEVKSFVEVNRSRLEALPSAFFQVCLTAADPSPEATADTARLLEDFQAETFWRPPLTATFAGMLAWTHYDIFTRTLMRLIVRKQHLPPEQLDPHRDVDYTDYEAVRRFAEAFAGLLDAP